MRTLWFYIVYVLASIQLYIFLSKIMIEVLYDEVSLIVDKVGGRRPLHGMDKVGMTQGKIDLRNESGRPMKVKVVGEVSEK